MTDAKPKEKTCFVIGPIGTAGSPERTGADWLLIRVGLDSQDEGYFVEQATRPFTSKYSDSSGCEQIAQRSSTGEVVAACTLSN